MDMIQLVFVLGLTVLTFWRKDIILYLILCPILLVTGLSWYDSYSTSAGMVTSIAFWLLAAYSAFLGIYNMLKGGE